MKDYLKISSPNSFSYIRFVASALEFNSLLLGQKMFKCCLGQQYLAEPLWARSSVRLERQTHNLLTGCSNRPGPTFSPLGLVT
jgi:hypothetical protein